MGTQLHGDSDLSKRQHQDLGFTTASCFILFYELITHIRVDFKLSGLNTCQHAAETSRQKALSTAYLCHRS